MLRFEVLGPMRAWRGDRELQVGSPQQRSVLAVLLLRNHRMVSRDEIVDAVWGENSPATAAGLVHTYIARLSRVLEPERSRWKPGQLLISTRSQYRLELETDQLDEAVFNELVFQAQRLRDSDQLDEAARAFDAAARLWQGTPLCAVPGPFAQQERIRLTEKHLAAQEERISVALTLGKHADVIGELRALIVTDPLRERLREQLLLALYRAGRKAEALRAYREARSTLVRELGVEPGPGLRRLHEAMLANDPDLLGYPDGGSPSLRQAVADLAAVPAGASGPYPVAELPPDITTFTGRDTELGLVQALLAGPRTPGVVPIIAVDGPGGVGKSALAIHAAHRLASRFPDGQLYATLRGTATEAPRVSPLEVAGRWLRSLGIRASEVPADLDEASARLRSLLSGRRVLILLDDVLDILQVRPLVPASTSCAVIVTSRRILLGLDGAAHLHLGALDEADAVCLLARLAGTSRVEAAPAAAAAIVRSCSRYPLAIRIASARMAARPGWPLDALADRLAVERCRLDELDQVDLSVRVSFNVSYSDLSASPASAQAARMFRLLGLLDGSHVSVALAAALADLSCAVAETALENLTDINLLESPVPGRYGMHDLLRLFAREQGARDEPEAGRTAAFRRALDYYLITALRAARALHPTDIWHTHSPVPAALPELEHMSKSEAVAWLHLERENLLAAAHQAANTEATRIIAAELAAALFRPFQSRGYWTELITLNQLAYDVATQAGDQRQKAQAQRRLGIAYGRLGHLSAEIAHLEAAMTTFRAIADRHGEAVTLNHLGLADRRQGKPGESVACLKQSLSLFRELGDIHSQARALGNLGTSYHAMGFLADALTCHTEALTIFRKVNDRLCEGLVLLNLAEGHRLAGQSGESGRLYRQSLSIVRELGHRYAEAEALWRLGQLRQSCGYPDHARAAWQQSLAILVEINLATADEAHDLLKQAVPHTPRAILLNA